MEHNHALAEKIRDARIKAGLSQQQMADALGINLRTAGNWERTGAVPPLRLAKLQQVLPALQVELVEAQGWTAEATNGHSHLVRYARKVPYLEASEETPVAQLKRLRRELTRIALELDDCLERLEQSQV
jgi:transcriptional regulator with XRE-family HTH domain